jgi:hypothetical protein
MSINTLTAALQHFDSAESNLRKLEGIWLEILGHISKGESFGTPPGYDDLCRSFRHILPNLPAIDGIRIEDRLDEYDTIVRMRLDAMEIGDYEASVSTENTIHEQTRLLEDYRFKLMIKRRELTRDRMIDIISEVDGLIRELTQTTAGKAENSKIDSIVWEQLKEKTAEIEAILGSAARPQKWPDLRRHLHFGMVTDFNEIVKYDWPKVKINLNAAIYGKYDPLPVSVSDLGELVASRPKGPILTKLDWSKITDEAFERLIYSILSETKGYENVEWLQHTNALDRGRDLSATKVIADQLDGIRRLRIMVQCKHWQSRSINIQDVSALKSQMELWQPPRVDELVIATTGRFTADAIDYIEKHNRSDRAMRISMWPDSHIERLLASRPHIIAQYTLNRIG